jgi:hypothetical protein
VGDVSRVVLVLRKKHACPLESFPEVGSGQDSPPL